MDQYQDIRNQLLSEKERLEAKVAEMDKYGLSDTMSFSTGELSQYDNHPADTATDLYERGKDIALNEHVQNELEEIKFALEKMDKGTYGICEVTGKKIPDERLQAHPTARTVVEEANDNVSHGRPVEEDVLGHFDKYNFDNRDDETEFDAEDSWQSVARFNDNSMVFEDASLTSSEELIGYVEEIEAFLSTGIEGYVGDEHVQVERNVQFDQYINRKDDEYEEHN